MTAPAPLTILLSTVAVLRSLAPPCMAPRRAERGGGDPACAPSFGKGPTGALGGPGGGGGPPAPPTAGDSGRAEPGRLLEGVEPDTPPKSMPARFALVCLTLAPPSSSLLSESLSLLAASPQSSSVLVRLGRIGVGLTTGGGGEAIAPVGGRKKGLLAPLGAPAAAAGEGTGLAAAAAPA